MSPIFQGEKEAIMPGVTAAGILALVTLFAGKGLTNIMNSMGITGEVATVSIPMIVGFLITELLNAYLPAWRPEGK